MDATQGKGNMSKKTLNAKDMLTRSSVDECIHSEVLQENIRMLVRDMDLSNGLITDEILQIGCLTEDEVHEMKNLSKQDQIRKLTSVLGRNNKSKFFKFLEVISKQEFYPHVEKLLKESYEKKLKENEKHYDTKCIRCFLVQKVEIKRIMDFLCEHQFIGLPDIEDAIKGDRTNADNFWGHVFQKIFDPINGESYCSVFKEALQDHYPHIARKIHCQNHLKCCCRSDLSKSYPSGSIGDSSEISTTTTIIPNTKPETCLWVEKTCSLHDNLKEIQEEKSEYLRSQQDGNFTQTKVSMPFPSTEFGTSLESVRFNTGNLNATADHHKKSFIQGKRTSSKFKWNRSSSGRRHLNYSVKGRMNKSRYKWVNSNTSSENKPFDNRSEN
ncbi:uncharacterized protein LOC133182426 [Saccostrea echinata]|uniref:uncharacterized protein LOC133182426 n=1 Tax=Saccostrea echinata TaxID=191078 RepID=UPI002A806988|nr:uncharacterized protein LOC133182426 [Saccostrea echinata]